MPLKVKICGITNPPDAAAAIGAGADALGFVFWQGSPRAVLPEAAAALASMVPLHVLKVGVFVDPEEELVYRAIRECGLNVLQFHGAESSEFCTQFGLMSMKAVRVRGPESVEACKNYHTEALLLDAWNPGLPGGTGEVFNWDLAVEVRKLGRPVFLAGGLTPDNVGEAIRKVRPFGVDVSSGVESAPGRKDHQRIQAFIRAAREAQRESS